MGTCDTWDDRSRASPGRRRCLRRRVPPRSDPADAARRSAPGGLRRGDDRGMSVEGLRWEGLLEGGELAYLGEEGAREARFAALPAELAPPLLAALRVERLYAHQRQACGAAARCEPSLPTTGTASGKTLAFNLPVLDAVARQPKSRALYLYPTKALAQ